MKHLSIEIAKFEINTIYIQTYIIGIGLGSQP